MYAFAKLMLWCLEFEYAFSWRFLGPSYLTALRQDIAHWEQIVDRMEIQS